ncbi:MAG: ABC transporter permease subunit [Acidimicrobiales bacterium]
MSQPHEEVATTQQADGAATTQQADGAAATQQADGAAATQPADADGAAATQPADGAAVTQPAGGAGAIQLRRLLRRNRPVLYAYGLLLALALIGQVITGGFLAPSHIDELIITGAFIAFVACGQTFVILTGGVDLSIPWTLNGAAVLLTLWAGGDSARMIWLVPLLIVGGAFIGLLNGVGVAFLRIPPIIMTLGMSSVVEGGLLLYTNGGSGGSAPPADVYLATHRWSYFPVVAILWIVVLVVATIVLGATPFGRRLYAVGLNSRVAYFAGVSVKQITVCVYVVSGMAGVIAGVALAGYVGGSYLGMGDPYLFASVAAVAIGGASILGGSGNYVGTTAGALALAVLAALLPVLGFPQAALEIVYGCVILGAIAVSSAKVGARRRTE